MLHNNGRFVRERASPPAHDKISTLACLLLQLICLILQLLHTTRATKGEGSLSPTTSEALSGFRQGCYGVYWVSLQLFYQSSYLYRA